MDLTSDVQRLTPLADSHLLQLCNGFATRRVGTAGNQQATAYFADAVSAYGFQTECFAFDCLDWKADGAALTAADESFAVFPGPFSPSLRVMAPLIVAETVEQLEALQAAGQVLLLRGEIASEPLMPKNFPFYTAESHQRILHALEACNPTAVITASAANSQMAGARYPYPLIEDGDFEIPSAYMTDEDGKVLAKLAGEMVALRINSRRIPAQGYQVVARKQPGAARRVVLFAHIDTKEGTPGALDNAAGVTTLLLLACLLEDFAGELGIEMVAVNGEEYYSAPGEVDYLHRNQGSLEQIALGINLDGVGYVHGKTAYSLYGCPQPVENRIHQAFSTRPDLIAGEPWYQGDHMLFLQNQRPALALTSEPIWELMTQVVHTDRDRPELVDRSRLVTIALALKELIESL